MKEVIIIWFTELFKAHQEALLDNNQDVFESLIDNLNFNEQSVSTKILELLCMLSKQNEKYLKEVIEKLIQRF